MHRKRGKHYTERKWHWQKNGDGNWQWDEGKGK